MTKEDNHKKGAGKKEGKDASHASRGMVGKPEYICEACGVRYSSGSKLNPVHNRSTTTATDHPRTSPGRCCCHQKRICPHILGE